MTTAYLGIGSNIDAPKHVPAGIQALRDTFDDVAFSPVYQSPAIGLEGDDFLNLVARVETDLPPLDLDAALHAIEDKQGRDRTQPRWSSRTLDIDILLYGDLWLLGPKLEIPRKEILTAAHVLKPLADLSPDLVHPVERKPIKELWAALSREGLQLQPYAL
ncbi:MAG: 2-amino-4-hydroxy-6-hydroxymethyldihydropteridine diphosphokinase [Xanthomonadales bacterium]|nr:2-amino-4-hydroxy-6-hydroxymethyldihydropteridine diphosphokinase [Gammaproteobacteria bacterium]MBT8050214.1 2-amino-4-hydroxy-6-hydroxymethyldihydropteridine diphosphokinase [Gammaproteobacteria bacterium]MBT8056551.1 2-amino-4-hydroxy-6-hydroxymethyldihydropteridine diphosphokinase [Gammaproteobacteria bacterium]NNJ77905.1 2-amino-4-hydroxy-6-hydroxymethyldihydropteridine diphosphokinase [Xanthomonadales bacterium]NNL04088.1 2-amino-4-hydroxy-6-hydroxymethyldihydropteridine diphosphokinas